MKFDVLAESIISSLVNEGRLSKASKYSHISVDANKLAEKLNSGDFEILTKGWAGNPRYASLSEDEIKEVIQNVASEIGQYEPSSFDELNSTIESVVDNVYANKGPNRKTYNARLTKAIVNLITHNEYGLVTIGEAPKAQENEYDVEGLSQVESAVLDFITQAELPTNIKDVESQFSNGSDIIDSLIEKGFVNRDGDTLVASGHEQGGRVLDTEDEDEENPLEIEPDIARTYRSTLGSSRSYDDDDSEDRSMGYVSSWKRR
jgi:hypothetical protein